MWSKLSLRHKLPALVVGASLIAAVAVGAASIIPSTGTVSDMSRERLQSVAEQRASEFRHYLEAVESDLASLSASPTTISAAQQFSNAFNALDGSGDAVDILKAAYIRNNPNAQGEKHLLDQANTGTGYDDTHGRYHPYFRNHLEQHGYYDVFLFNADGDLVYSVFKEEDFATNFRSGGGQWAASGLGDAFRAAITGGRQQISFVDFEAYGPSNGAPASFVSVPIFDGNDRVGVLAFQMSSALINEIMSNTVGLGETGEALIVGADSLMRNDSDRTSANDILAAEIEIPVIEDALRGNTAYEANIRFRDQNVSAAAVPFEFHDVRWVILSTQAMSEIYAPVWGALITALIAGLLAFFAVAGGAYLLSARIARPIARTHAGLDSASTGIMIADADYTITHHNPALSEMMRNAEEDLRKVFSDFRADNLIGRNIDVFHANPQYQRAILDKLSKPHSVDLEVGDRHFTLIANPIFDEQNRRIGTVVEWDDVTEKVIELRTAKELAESNARILAALENATTNVMIADHDGNIVYMNGSQQDMMKEAEADLRRELPNFDARSLVGQNFDVFHKNPAHQRNLISHLRDTFVTEISVGPRTFQLIANPVHNDDGDRVGTVVEWQDRTAEKQIETEIASVVEAVGRGDFAQTLNLEGKDGFYLTLAEGINEVSDTVSGVLDSMADMLSALSQGDLTRRIHEDYEGVYGELKGNANAMASKLQETVQAISAAAEEVSSGAQQISTGANDLSLRTEQQAANLEETAASMEEMASTIKQNADNSNQASQLASTARDSANKGGEVVSDAVDAMGKIEESSRRISDIIGVIDEIAFQTNLLALNAAVEAARAGDAGRGFAVVASEVRSLAQRSAQAAKDIKDLIVDSTEQVQGGVELVNQTGESLNEIVDSIKRVADIVAEISAASREQATGADEINQAVTQMDEMTQQNSALVEENAAAAKTMNDQATRMRQRMSFFNAGQASAAAFAAPVAVSAEQQVAQAAPSSAGARGLQVALAESVQDEDDDWSEF